MRNNKLAIYEEAQKELNALIVRSPKCKEVFDTLMEITSFKQITVVTDAQEASDLFMAMPYKFDIIISAFSTTTINGAELLNRVKNRYMFKKTILLISKEKEHEFIEGVSHLFADSLIVCNNNPDILIEAVGNVAKSMYDYKLLLNYIYEYEDAILKKGMELSTNTPTQITDHPLHPSSTTHKKSSIKGIDAKTFTDDLDEIDFERIENVYEDLTLFENRLLASKTGEVDTMLSIVSEAQLAFGNMIISINTFGKFKNLQLQLNNLLDLLNSLKASSFGNKMRNLMLIDILIGLTEEVLKWIDGIFRRKDVQDINTCDKTLRHKFEEIETLFTRFKPSY